MPPPPLGSVTDSPASVFLERLQRQPFTALAFVVICYRCRCRRRHGKLLQFQHDPPITPTSFPPSLTHIRCGSSVNCFACELFSASALPHYLSLSLFAPAPPLHFEWFSQICLKRFVQISSSVASLFPLPQSYLFNLHVTAAAATVGGVQHAAATFVSAIESPKMKCSTMIFGSLQLPTSDDWRLTSAECQVKCAVIEAAKGCSFLGKVCDIYDISMRPLLRRACSPLDCQLGESHDNSYENYCK